MKRVDCVEAKEQSKVEHSIVQILVVVANIQAKSLKTEVEKGFLGTVFDQELVDPKLCGNSNVIGVKFSLKIISNSERESG